MIIFNNKRAFTLIELLVVITVLGILVLLAMPRFIGQTDKAFETSIIHDARLVQDAAERYHLDNDEFPFLYEENESGELEAVVAGNPSQYEILHKVMEFNDDNPNVELYEVDFRKLDNYIKINNDEGYFVAARGNPDFGITVLKPGAKSTEARLSNSIIDDGNMDNEGKDDPEVEAPEYYKLASDKDFEFIPNRNAPNEYNGEKGYYKYIGEDEYVTVPHKLHGQELKDYYNMFNGSDVKGVASDNPYVTNMRGMFTNSKSEHLDLRHLDTYNVTNMMRMFSNSSAIELDLSGLDFSNVSSTSQMFFQSSGVRGYAKTEADVKFLNNLSSTPDKLLFMTYEQRDFKEQVTFTPEGYVLATIDDFEFIRNNNAPNEYYGRKGHYKYIGNDEYVTVPHKLHGQELKDYYNMFNGSDVKGVASNNPYVINMMNMFTGSRSEHLDLRHLDTSNVTNMARMFSSSNTISIDLSNLDTSNVTNMARMFSSSSVIELDLSSFDFSNVSSTSQMFFQSSAVRGYAKTESDVKFLNNLSSTPDKLLFMTYEQRNFKEQNTSTPEGYVLATINDFEFTRNNNAPNEYYGRKGYYKYVGNDDYVAVPHKLHGQELKDYYNMFNGSDVKGVASNNPYVMNMMNMFTNSRSEHLDLRHLDTSNVTNMSRMFSSSNAISINLSELDTSNVTNMARMFSSSSMIELDLSSFDFSSVSSTSQMFFQSSAVRGYAKTESDVKFLNNLSSTPSRLSFIVR